MSDISNSEYKKLADFKARKSPIIKDCVFAFVIGGFICAIGQVLMELYKAWGLSEKIASPTVAISLIVLSAVLTALNAYDKIAKYAGAGTLVPITGFANSVVSPAMEYVPEGWILGVGVKMFTIAGPVLAYGGLTSVICGIIYYFLGR